MGKKTFENDGLDKSTKPLPSIVPSIVPAQKEAICGDQNLDRNIACMTPEKVDEYLKGKSKDHMIKLQEKCQAIVESFDCLTCSLRLLKLRKKLSTFHNICCQVAVMAKRKFLHKHLAQIKYIIPEAVHIDKVIIHDKKTLCMKTEMVISLQFDILEGHQEHSDFLALHKVFASRVMKYFVVHPEKSDVPEGALPEPFNHANIMCLRDQLYDTSSEKSQLSVENKLSFEESWPYPSFKRHFSQKAVSEAGISESVTFPVVLSSTTSLNKECNIDRLLEGSTDSRGKLDTVTNQGIKTGLEKNSSGRAATAADRSAQPISPQVSDNSSESPLFKPVISAPSISVQTPVQLTPKRSMPISDVKVRTITSTESLSKPAKRFLNFSGLEGDKGTSSGSSLDDLQCCEIPQSTHKVSSGGNTTGSLAVSLQEEEICQAQKNHTSGVICQESSSLPDLVRVIYHIFKSVNCFSITKEELMHKIIMNSLDITERREVEEQIEQLEKLVPDWISRKSTSSGQITFNINATEDLESVVVKIVHI